jgi:hypothetical protein
MAAVGFIGRAIAAMGRSCPNLRQARPGIFGGLKCGPWS